MRESRTDRTTRTNSNAGFRKYKLPTPQPALTSLSAGGASRTTRTDRGAIARRREVVNVKTARKRHESSSSPGACDRMRCARSHAPGDDRVVGRQVLDVIPRDEHELGGLTHSGRTPAGHAGFGERGPPLPSPPHLGEGVFNLPTPRHRRELATVARSQAPGEECSSAPVSCTLSLSLTLPQLSHEHTPPRCRPPCSGC